MYEDVTGIRLGLLVGQVRARFLAWVRGYMAKAKIHLYPSKVFHRARP